MPKKTKEGEKNHMKKQKTKLKIGTENSKNKSLTSKSGITLIALVITIIVMLILVAVTVNVALNGGLIGKTQEAKTKTEEAQIQERDLLKGRIKIGDTWYDSLDKYLEGTPSDDQNEGTLKVTLKVEEASVTGTQIPVTVEKVTQREDESQTVEENLTYEWYYEENNKSTGSDKQHTFEGLKEDQSYTLKCKVSDDAGNWGIGEVTVISFKIANKYYRATGGMNWNDFCHSKYDRSAPTGMPKEDVYHDHSDNPRWGEIEIMADNQGVAIRCLQCSSTTDGEFGYTVASLAYAITGEPFVELLRTYL